MRLHATFAILSYEIIFVYRNECHQIRVPVNLFEFLNISVLDVPIKRCYFLWKYLTTQLFDALVRVKLDKLISKLVPTRC